MKSYVVVNYYLAIIYIKFHSDMCINTSARVENAHNRDKTCAPAFETRARAFMHKFLRNLKYKPIKAYLHTCILMYLPIY